MGQVNHDVPESVVAVRHSLSDAVILKVSSITVSHMYICFTALLSIVAVVAKWRGEYGVIVAMATGALLRMRGNQRTGQGREVGH